MVGVTKCSKPKAIENGRKIVIACYKPGKSSGKGKYIINFFKYDKSNYDVKSGQPVELHSLVNLPEHEFVIDAFSVPAKPSKEHPRSRDYPMITHIYIRSKATEKEPLSSVYARLEEEKWDPALVSKPPRVLHSDIANFPKENIVSIESDARNLMIATSSQDSKTNSIVICSLSDPKNKRCGNSLELEAFLKHEDSKVEPIVSITREHPYDDILNVIVFDTHRVKYYEILTLENGVDIEFDTDVKKIEYVF